MRMLRVCWDGRMVGLLTRVGSRDMSFRYDEAYLASDRAAAISLSLPLRPEPFGGEPARAWFANLLPEGEVRGHIARRLGVSERNDFDLLAGVGGECAGALRLLAEDDADGPEGDGSPQTPVPLPWDRLEAMIAASPRVSLLAAMMQTNELRLSLAGAQDKLPVRYHDGTLALPAPGAPSTHLVKTASGGFPDLVRNEFYCMCLAREVGLMVPDVQLAPTTLPILLIERYDRRREPNGSVRRLHQEDFCQALGCPPETKYENEGGPPLDRMFGILARGSHSPLPDKRALLRWVLFNFFIGNADAHAKNVSFLHGEDGTRLAPFYDLVCTAAYHELSLNLAQKIGGEYRPATVGLRHWERFADAVQINERYLRSSGLELGQAIEAAAEPLAKRLAAEHGGRETYARIREVVAGRLRRFRTAFAA